MFVKKIGKRKREISLFLHSFNFEKMNYYTIESIMLYILLKERSLMYLSLQEKVDNDTSKFIQVF